MWVQDSRRIDFTELSKSKTLINAFEHHEELTNKELLYANLRSYCINKGHELSLMPVTFSVNFNRPLVSVQSALSEFLHYYIANHPKGEKLKLRGSFTVIRDGRELSIRYKDMPSAQPSLTISDEPP